MSTGSLSLGRELDVRVAEARGGLSGNDERILGFLRDHLDELAFHTAESLAQGAGVSAAAVVRFSRRLGFASFRELRDRARDELQAGRADEQEAGSSASVLGRKVERDIASLGVLPQLLDVPLEAAAAADRRRRAPRGSWPTARPTGSPSTRSACCTRCTTTSGSSTPPSPIRCARSAPTTSSWRARSAPTRGSRCS